MLTSLYSQNQILERPFSSFSGGYHSRSWLMGLLGRWAMSQGDMVISQIANLFGVSRQAVYRNVNRLTIAETARQGVPANCIRFTSQDIDKTILSLALDAHASIEGIQRVITRIYGKEASRSIGYISNLLTRAGAFAAEITSTLPLQKITQGANDEIFDASDKPIFTGVDVESTYIYLMQDMNDRKGETWELAMETLKELGLNLHVAISDAGSGLLKGIKSAFPEADIQVDVFHVLRDIGRSVYRFKEHVLKELAIYYNLESAVASCKSPWRDKAKEKKKKFADYTAKIPAMVEDYDTLTCLYSWVHELVSFSGYHYDEVMELMDWLLDEMKIIAGRNSWAYKLSQEITRFRERLPATMLFLSKLFRNFSNAAQKMNMPYEVFRLLYRRLGVSPETTAYVELTQQAMEIAGSEKFNAVEKVHDEIVSGIKRASSLVENVNSRLRAYMNVKKHVSSNFYSLVQLYLNTRKYRRSRIESRKGLSPVELLTGDSWPEFIDLLEERGFWKETNAKIIA